jgi:hypothetical protein
MDEVYGFPDSESVAVFVWGCPGRSVDAVIQRGAKEWEETGPIFVPFGEPEA